MCLRVFIKLHITAQPDPVILVMMCVSVRVCVCIVIPFILDVWLVDAPAGVTHAGFLHLPSAVLAKTFLLGIRAMLAGFII